MLNPQSLAARKFVARGTQTAFHPIDLCLLAGQAAGFASRKLTGSDTARDPLALILLTFVDTVSTLSRRIGYGESETQ